ncbi:hypothetical protein Glove_199g113 [Diversispora epigaea]|uniref:Uncharacterized protein n=1 Tax=Diversispora epigaea TaxID=1348612 RepID=A0A397IT87_9GLOM|nr:hypothetical protein Glove_199g113 [Diversispora epigaea]
MELEKHSKDLREKVYHKLMREVFNIKIFYEASKQDGHMTQAKFYKNRIEKYIHKFLSHIGEDKKEWLSRGVVKALRLSTTSQKLLNLLDMAEYKELEIPALSVILQSKDKSRYRSFTHEHAIAEIDIFLIKGWEENKFMPFQLQMHQ